MVLCDKTVIYSIRFHLIIPKERGNNCDVLDITKITKKVISSLHKKHASERKSFIGQRVQPVLLGISPSLNLFSGFG